MSGILSTLECCVLRGCLLRQDSTQTAQLRKQLVDKLSPTIPTNESQLSHDVNVDITFTKNEQMYIQYLANHAVNAMHNATAPLNPGELQVFNALKRIRNVIK